MNKKTKSNIYLLITSIIWGTAFVAQKAGTTLEPFTYTGSRNLVGALAILPVIWFMSRKQRSSCKEESENGPLLKAGIICGIFMAIASSLQQMGMYFHTDAGKAGFITTLYIVIVPILGILVGRRSRPMVWLCALLGAAGFYMLTMAGKSNGFTMEKGDFFVLLCAFVFSCHILLVDHYSRLCDCVKLSFVQFLVAGLLCLIPMFLFENPHMSEIIDCAGPILYCGIMSSGVAYTLQIMGQRHAEPAAASLILSLESVFAVISGALLLGEKMTLLELSGCVIIFVAVILAQLPEKSK